MDQTKLRLLVVDDDKLSRISMQRFLERLGHEALTADNGASALQQLAQLDLDAIFLDLQMPVLDGCETAQAIRSMGGPHSGLPLICLSGFSNDNELSQARISGMDAFLAKPVDMGLLKEVLDKICLAKQQGLNGRMAL